MVTFLSKLKAMKLTEFKFTSFEKKVSTSNEEGERFTYLVLTLENPWPEVVSTLTDYDPGKNQRVHDIAFDVVRVNCNLDLIEKYESEFTFDLDSNEELVGTGSYAGDMFLDLARSREVWLTDTKLSTLSQEWKKKGQEKRVSGIMQRYLERTKQADQS